MTPSWVSVALIEVSRETCAWSGPAMSKRKVLVPPPGMLKPAGGPSSRGTFTLPVHVAAPAQRTVTKREPSRS